MNPHVVSSKIAMYILIVSFLFVACKRKSVTPQLEPQVDVLGIKTIGNA